MDRERTRHSVTGSDLIRRPRSVNLWRPISFSNFLTSSDIRRSDNNVLHSLPSTESVASSNTPTDEKVSQQSSPTFFQTLKEKSKKGWNTIVMVDVVGARGLPDPPTDGSSHYLCCKIVLGIETRKTKKVQSSKQPVWQERVTLHLQQDHLLRVSLWDKGKQKNFMGCGTIDLSTLEKERTHELLQTLDKGFGTVHLNVTMCAIRQNGEALDSGPTLEKVKEKIDIFNFNDWRVVGQLHVKLIGARGLSGKPSAYCIFELANAMVQTPTAKPSSEPVWKKNYVLDVHDVTNTLEIKVFDNFRASSLGKVTVPLLRVKNGEPRWYALKNKGSRSTARGNCPRILVEISLIFNPLKASLRLFQPMEKKYIEKKPRKFDLGVVHTNVVFIRDLFQLLCELNEFIKQLFEWENREVSTGALIGWLVFWYHFQPWTVPLLLLLPFIYFWIFKRNNNQTSSIRKINIEDTEENDLENKPLSLKNKIAELPEVILVVTAGIEFIQSLWERVFNLVSFKLPFVSYLTMILLVISSAALCFIPFNYIMMGLGIYKYTRKYVNPERTLSNDLLDFILRLPDNEILKDWEELNVPEPQYQRHTSDVMSSTTGSKERISRSHSNNL